MERIWLEYMANALWQIPLLACAAWLLLRALRPSVLVQHTLWIAALALSVLLPVRGIHSSPAALAPLPATPHLAGLHAAPSPSTGLAAPILHSASPASLAWCARVRFLGLTPLAAHALVVLSLALVFAGFVRILLAWRAVRRICVHSLPAVLTAAQSRLFHDCARRLRVSPPALRHSAEVAGPMLSGVRAPILLLPLNFFRHSEEELTAAFCHELAHLARHDYLLNLLFRIASLPVSWHPATHAVLHRIHRTREMICDSIAARQMHSRLGYARCLLSLAQQLLLPRNLPDQQSQALGLFGHNTLEERVMRLTEVTRPTSLYLKNPIKTRAEPSAPFLICRKTMSASP